MLMEKWIVLEGDVVSGLEFYGPFNTHNDATSFASVPCYYPSYITGSYGIEHITKNFPRAAEDDRIVFTGIDVTLFAPYGLGEGMRNRLLEEIAKVR